MGLRFLLTGFFIFSSVCGGLAAEIFRCDFEENELCGFVQQTTDGFDWERRSGSTPTKETGPSGDHSLVNGTGHYIHIEASNKGTGTFARIETPFFESLDKLSQNFCLRFFYHMYGKHMGTLNVYAEITDSHRSVTNNLIWNKTGERGDLWVETEIDFNIADDTEEFKVIFEGIRGENFKSDIGVDDVSITDKSCYEKIFTDLSPKDCQEVVTVAKAEKAVVMVEMTTSNVVTGDQQTNSSLSAQVASMESPITLRTLLIVVCCGVAFWTFIFVVVTVYILRHKPPTVEQLMKKYQNKNGQQNMNTDELETIAIGTTIVNQTADINNSINDEIMATGNCNHNVEERKDKHYMDKQIDTGFYDTKSVQLPMAEVSSDESDELALRCQDSDDDGSLFKELLQRFPRMSDSNLS